MDEILVEKIVEKPGNTNGKDWVRYGIKDGNGEWYSTFSKELVAKLTEGQKARIQYETKPVNGRVMKNLVAVEELEPGVPESYSHQTPSGEADWDKVALGKTRCLLWAEYLSGQVAASVYLKAASADGIDPRDAVIRTGVMLVVAAEKDIFERPPGDDGVPF